METISATQARSQLFQLLKDAIRRNRQFRIVHKEGEVILLSEEEYESLLETLFLLSSPGFRKAYRQARREIEKDETLSLEEVFGHK